MTGFGKSVLNLDSKKITIEVKSLNSKQADVNLRMPTLYRELEPEIRRKLVGNLDRGKIDFNLYCEITGPEKASRINEALVLSYLKQLKDIQGEAGVSGDPLSAVMRLPEVMQSAESEIEEGERKEVFATIEKALNALIDFRRTEGGQMKSDLMNRLSIIEERMASIVELEPERIEKITEKINRGLADIAEKPDQNRFEQEMIYYMERLDITEEKVRLKSHLDYFRQLLSEGGTIGKKLGFVSQEMGREINTMGSKANHAGIQKLVVQMKDELEKIKEQVLNIL